MLQRPYHIICQSFYLNILLKKQKTTHTNQRKKDSVTYCFRIKKSISCIWTLNSIWNVSKYSKKNCRQMDMEPPAFSVKKQAYIPLHLILWVCNWGTWSLQCCSTPSTAQKSSQVSQKSFQNKHGLLDSRVRQQSHGALSALPRHFPVPKLVQPSANCSWTLSHVTLEMNWLESVNWWCTNHSPFLLPLHFFLSRKILLTTITNITFLFMVKKATHIAHQYQQTLSRKH